MATNDHIIRQATLNFQFQQSENKFAIPGRIESWFLQKALEEIGEVCDELVAEAEDLEIGTLKIDLGLISELQFENNLETIFKQKFRHHLKLHVGKMPRNILSHSHSQPAKKKRLVKVMMDFIFKGYFGWQSSFKSISELEKEIIRTFDADGKVLWQTLIPKMDNSLVCQRLAFNFSGVFIQWLVRKIINHQGSNLEWKWTQEDWKAYETKETALVQLNRFLAELQAVTPTSKKPLPNILLKRDINPKPTLNINEQEADEEGIFVSNAGVILMHPFLAALFANLGLTSGDSFKSNKSKEKAIWLLHYMVYGRLDLDESQTVLPKLLCGMLINDALLSKPVLSQEEKREVNQVIEQAIRHWVVLKNTAVDSLQETFFQREGQVLIKETFIELNVAQKSVDMLLGHLPWSLSRIQLPWMEKTIRVNWA